MAHYDEGNYQCTITSQGFASSKAKGTPYFFVRFRTGDNMYERECQCWLTEKTVDKLVNWLTNLGIAAEKWSDLDPCEGGQISLVGMTVELQCQHEDSQDGSKVYEKWELPYDPFAKAQPPMEAKQVRDLDRLFGSALKPDKAKMIAKASAAAPSPAADPGREHQPVHQPVSEGVGTGYKGPVNDDEIPF